MCRARRSRSTASCANSSTLLADNPSQLKNLAQLRILVEHQLGMMHAGADHLPRWRPEGNPDDHRRAGQGDSDEIRLQVVIMLSEQNELLDARSAAFYNQYRHAVMLGLGINAAAIAVLLLFYRLVRRSFDARARPSTPCSRPTNTSNRWWRAVPSSCRCCRAT